MDDPDLVLTLLTHDGVQAAADLVAERPYCLEEDIFKFVSGSDHFISNFITHVIEA